ncbi:MAG: ATP-binding protein [Defluviitaleaceae bacterium]|nr:ATP-binding protein [Defluviitaleaceae bacterium]
MGKVILICGKIGSGKTTYAKNLASKLNAVNISHDEIMLGLFGADLYTKDLEQFQKYCNWVEEYVKRKAGEAAKAGATVICENGFWSCEERAELRKFYADMNVECEVHYIDTPEEQRIQNIEKRNQQVRDGDLGYIFTQHKDINHFFEEPSESEIDCRVKYN